MQEKKVKIEIETSTGTNGNGHGESILSFHTNDKQTNSSKEIHYKKRGILAYGITDYLTALTIWTCFFLYRKLFIENYTLESPWNELLGKNYFLGIIIIPLCWLALYFIVGTYTDIYRKSRLAEFTKTLAVSITGATVLFFLLILDDNIVNYKTYYQSYFALLSLHFFWTLFGRMVVLAFAKNQLESGRVGYQTLIIGGNKNAVDLYKEITSYRFSLGYKFVGFVDMNGNGKNGLNSYLPNLGKIEKVNQIINEQRVEDVIIAIETSEHHQLNHIISFLSDKNIVVKIIPDMYDILSGSVKMKNVIGAALIEITPELIPSWQMMLKRIFDVVASALVLLLLSPLFILIAIRVKLSSSGEILYVQERIGLHGKPFKMYKFRSMYVNAEENGPMLSKEDDERIFPWGKVMRKWRLDELPQFYHVLMGEMSLVGPRPERQFYIDQICESVPQYKYLHKVKPGITSWGMVKFGYASTVEEMIRRMKYDLLYLENMSLAIDFRIMIYTVLIIFQGKGK